MRLVLVIAIYFVSFLGRSQDTLLQQEFENIDIQFNAEKEIAFGDSKHYIIDFHIGEKGNFLLLKRRSNYFLFSLTDDLNYQDSLKLNFKPTKLFADCLGFLHILGRDSMSQIEMIQSELLIYETNPISLYDDFLRDCIASNNTHLIFKHLENYNQSTVYFGVNKVNQEQVSLYRIEDRMLIHSAKDTHDSLALRNPGETAIMSEIRGFDLEFADYYESIQDHNQRQNFFDQIVTRPDYLPVFVNQDTTFIFDYVNKAVVALNDSGSVYRTAAIPYKKHLKIEFDRKKGTFYAVSQEKGVQTYQLLSSENFGVVSRTKIAHHARPSKTMIYNGYIYYMSKEYVGDNLNKLFRQRMQRW